jgi:hypothetical protein
MWNFHLHNRASEYRYSDQLDLLLETILVKTGERRKIGEVEVVGNDSAFVIEFIGHGALELVSFTEHEAFRLKNELQEWLNRNIPVKVEVTSKDTL